PAVRSVPYEFEMLLEPFQNTGVRVFIENVDVLGSSLQTVVGDGETADDQRGALNVLQVPDGHVHVRRGWRVHQIESLPQIKQSAVRLFKRCGLDHCRALRILHAYDGSIPIFRKSSCPALKMRSFSSVSGERYAAQLGCPENPNYAAQCHGFPP